MSGTRKAKGFANPTVISITSRMCSGNSSKWRLTCDDERVLGGGCAGLVMMMAVNFP